MHAVLRERPDIAIVDIRLPPTFRDEGAAGGARAARASLPETAVLIVSQYVEQAYAAELLADGRAAASATCSRTGSWTCDDFVDAVRRVAAGGTALDPEVVAQLSRAAAAAGRSTTSPRASSRCSS